MARLQLLDLTKCDFVPDFILYLLNYYRPIAIGLNYYGNPLYLKKNRRLLQKKLAQYNQDAL